MVWKSNCNRNFYENEKDIQEPEVAIHQIRIILRATDLIRGDKKNNPQIEFWRPT